GDRLAKRDGAVTLRDRLARGESIAEVMGRLCASLGLAGCRTAADVLERLDPASLVREPWVVDLPGCARSPLPLGAPPEIQAALSHGDSPTTPITHQAPLSI